MRSNDGNPIQELARVPKMIFLPLVKPSTIHPYHIHKLAGTLNGLGRSGGAPVDSFWVAERDRAKMRSNDGNPIQELARVPKIIFLPLL